MPEATPSAISRHAELFMAHRPALVGAAYRVLSSVSDAEDVVQEAWLRWSQVELAEVREPRAYLLRITTRLALNRVREQQRRRETYVGPWLPEPWSGPLAAGGGSDPGDAAELADSVSMAMLVVLSSLSPLERAVFVLREVFDVPFSEVAETLGRSEEAVRQLAHRARSHVQARTPQRPVDGRTHQAVTEKFLAAVQGGSIQSLLTMLAPDAVLTTDGGGLRQAALRPIVGADKIIRFLIGVVSKAEALSTSGTKPSFQLTTANGQAAIVALVDGVPDTLGLLGIDGSVVTELFLVRNPEKLARFVVGDPPP